MFPDGRLIAVDTETTGLHCQLGHRPFMWSFANEDEDATVVDFEIDPVTREVLYRKKPKTFKRLKTYLEDPTITKVFFNALFDVSMCEAAGISVAGKVEDASFALRIVGIPRPFWKLKAFSKKYLGIPDDDEKALKKMTTALRRRGKLVGWEFAEQDEADYWLAFSTINPLLAGAKCLKSWSNIERSERKLAELLEKTEATFQEAKRICREYCKTDSIRTIRGWLALREVLKESKQTKIYREEMRLIYPVTKTMYDVGLALDMTAVRRGIDVARKLARKCVKKLRQKVKPSFNPASSKDKFEYFIEKKKMTPLAYTPKGAPKLDKFFMEHYDSEDEVCALINEHSVNTKAMSTYFRSFRDQSPQGVLHDRMNQIGTVTGRFSGWLHTIPKRAKEGSIMLEVRKCFVPRPGHVWVCMDYSQIEARIFADEFQEETMLAAFAEGRDVYVELKDTIERETGVVLLRQIAKNIFLGKIYGLGKFKMIATIRDASDVKISTDECEEVIYAFDETFPIVRTAMQQTNRLAKSQGYVENRYGQRVPVDFDFSYRGVNYIIQPTAARLMKSAMWRSHEFLQDYAGVGNLLLQIHDELVFELPDDDRLLPIARELKRIVEDNEGMFPLVTTPVEVDVCRKNWLDRSPLDV